MKEIHPGMTEKNPNATKKIEGRPLEHRILDELGAGGPMYLGASKYDHTQREKDLMQKEWRRGFLAALCFSILVVLLWIFT